MNANPLLGSLPLNTEDYITSFNTKFWPKTSFKPKLLNFLSLSDSHLLVNHLLTVNHRHIVKWIDKI
jgi:hypothetical protein